MFKSTILKFKFKAACVLLPPLQRWIRNNPSIHGTHSAEEDTVKKQHGSVQQLQHKMLESKEEMQAIQTGDEEDDEDSREGFLEDRVFKLKS